MKQRLLISLPTDRNNPKDHDDSRLDFSYVRRTSKVRRIYRSRLNKYALILLLIRTLLACKDIDDRPRCAFLYDFEIDSELDRFVRRCGETLERTQEFVTHGQYGLRLEFFFGKDPGLKPILYHKNWSNYRTLQFDVFNPQDEPVYLTLKIAKDRYAEYPDRVDRQLQIPLGRQHFAIPLYSLVLNSGEGKLDLDEIGHCKIYMKNPQKKYVLFFDYLHLE